MSSYNFKKLDLFCCSNKNPPSMHRSSWHGLTCREGFEKHGEENKASFRKYILFILTIYGPEMDQYKKSQAVPKDQH
jgi:hypothetical protein